MDRPARRGAPGRPAALDRAGPPAVDDFPRLRIAPPGVRSHKCFPPGARERRDVFMYVNNTNRADEVCVRRTTLIRKLLGPRVFLRAADLRPPVDSAAGFGTLRGAEHSSCFAGYTRTLSPAAAAQGAMNLGKRTYRTSGVRCSPRVGLCRLPRPRAAYEMSPQSSRSTGIAWAPEGPGAKAK
jgi:hypothetical protein